MTAIPRTPFLLWRIGISRTLCGDVGDTHLLADEMNKRFPKDVDAKRLAPLLRAAIEIQRGHHDQGLQLLQTISRYESGTYFWMNYLRGRAYLEQRKGYEAAAEFQKIIDHRGWSPVSALYFPAHLWLSRALVLQGDTVKAKQNYDEFFRLWKDADADLPVLIEAKKEYEKLK